MVARVATGNKSTGRYVPGTFKYKLTVPTLRGAKAEVKRAFDKKMDALVAAELKSYAKGALTQDQFNTAKAHGAGALSGDDYLEFCEGSFEGLVGKFTSSVYKGRCASIVLTFLGQNAACSQLGGLWIGYQTDRSVTIDTKTGAFRSVTDFTSNADGKVTAAVRAWYAKQPHEFF
ncbi:MAG: hypothetical protein LBJ08_08960 [Bifidobacteriaceae bacterium]|nr:hypothetical protein [Bifidobacteriaceae bacterium]